MWRNKDAAVEAQARASYDSLPSARTRKVTADVRVSGSLGQVWRSLSLIRVIQCPFLFIPEHVIGLLAMMRTYGALITGDQMNDWVGSL